MDQKDYFISYTSPDRAWAEWIAWILEEGACSVIIQAWDFIPGKNFVLEMDDAATRARHTIAVLSPDYLNSGFAAPEWAAALSRDPKGLQSKLVPVMVRRCDLQGLLRSVVHIDLTELDESTARQRLVSGLLQRRAKPDRAPEFPGTHRVASQPTPFPGGTANDTATDQNARQYFIPRVRGTLSDLDRARFVKDAFQRIQAYFQAGSTELGKQPGIDIDFSVISPEKFTVEVFVHGRRKAQCKIWLGGMLGRDQISYYEGPFDGNDSAMNEALTLADHQGELAFSALMNMGIGLGQASTTLNPNSLSASEAGEYLWRRFMWRLG